VTPGRLCDITLGLPPPDIERPRYDRAKVTTGVVHFGPGAFHRAHQAYYFDRMLQRRSNLGVCAVSLRSGELAAALAPQDGLYTLVRQDRTPALQVIGAIKHLVEATAAPQRVLSALADPAVRLATATVTEKGYCLDAAGALDLDHPEVRQDLVQDGPPSTLVGWLAAGLARRRRTDAGGLTVLSCDNLADNGPTLRRAVLRYVDATGDEALADWIEEKVRFPATMVDAITPATDAALREMVEARLGLQDAWPVQREAFVQWVVEDDLAGDRNDFEAAGVNVSPDVRGFERAKLRLLNGAHSTLAYIGLNLGLQTVAEAMTDRALAVFVERLMREDIAPCVGPVRGLDGEAYVASVLTRFRNPAIVHRLSQIACDGSQKLPIRLLASASEAVAAGRPIERFAVAVSAWVRFVCERARQDAPITDPLAETLMRLGRARDPLAFLRLSQVFPPELAANPVFAQAVVQAFRRLDGDDPRSVLAGQ
jgi:fructuronate reductase